MSERIAPEPIRPPAESRLRAALRFGVIGLGLGLIGSAIFIIPQQRPANGVTKVFSEARAVLLTARVERGVWPPDGELPAMLGEGRAPRLRALLAECPLAGTWRFVGVKTGGPAIIFTPAETGQPYERCLRLVDTWLDDGDPATGDLVIGPERARLRLSVE
jgi:hypothetical protein